MALGPGQLYVGDFEAEEPVDSAVNTTPAASAWTDVGATLGGITLTTTKTYTKLECDQLNLSPESRLTGESIQLKTRLAETTLTNLKLAFNSDGTSDSGSGYETYEPADQDSSNEPTYKAIIYDGYGAGGYRRRAIIRKVLNIEEVPIEASKENQQAFNVTFDAHYVSSAVKPYKIIQAVAVA
jgi:hypothetical protein